MFITCYLFCLVPYDMERRIKDASFLRIIMALSKEEGCDITSRLPWKLPSAPNSLIKTNISEEDYNQTSCMYHWTNLTCCLPFFPLFRESALAGAAGVSEQRGGVGGLGGVQRDMWGVGSLWRGGAPVMGLPSTGGKQHPPPLPTGRFFIIDFWNIANYYQSVVQAYMEWRLFHFHAIVLREPVTIIALLNCFLKITSKLIHWRRFDFAITHFSLVYLGLVFNMFK